MNCSATGSNHQPTGSNRWNEHYWFSHVTRAPISIKALGVKYNVSETITHKNIALNRQTHKILCALRFYDIVLQLNADILKLIFFPV